MDGRVVMTEKRRVDVTIDGRSFTIVGTETEEYIKSLANYVDKKIKNLSSKNDKLSQTMSATLAALHIADELHRANNKYNKLEEMAKDPLEKYDEVCEKLNDSTVKIESLEKVCSEYQETILQLTSEKESLLKRLEEHEKTIRNKDKIIEESKKEIKSLQKKNLETQVELVETKKELAEYLKLLDTETSSY